MRQKKLNVGLGNRAYEIIIGPDLIDQAGEILGQISADRHVIVVSDKSVAKLHLSRLKASLKNHARAIDHFEIPAGEGSKSLNMLSKLLNSILAIGIDRSVLLIAFGGGVVGDLTGFAAAILLRGVDYVQLPTTLLAQVDSSVGGKTGVNAIAGKNLIGAFHQPKAVIADTNLLATLSMRELKAGYAEVIKYGVLGDAEFFSWMELNSANILAFAHALEAEAGYNGSLLHGEAVAAGIGLAFDLSVDLGFCKANDAARCKTLLHENGLPTGLRDLKSNNAKASRILKHMKHDKKVLNGKMHFILVRAIGDAFLSGDVPPKIVKALLQRGHDVI